MRKSNIVTRQFVASDEGKLGDRLREIENERNGEVHEGFGFKTKLEVIAVVPAPGASNYVYYAVCREWATDN